MKAAKARVAEALAAATQALWQTTREKREKKGAKSPCSTIFVASFPYFSKVKYIKIPLLPFLPRKKYNGFSVKHCWFQTSLYLPYWLVKPAALGATARLGWIRRTLWQPHRLLQKRRRKRKMSWGDPDVSEKKKVINKHVCF